MAKSTIREFKGTGGLFYLVNTAADASVPGGIYGPFHSRKECRAARALVPDHERSNIVCDRGLRPQPHDERDVNPLTR